MMIKPENQLAFKIENKHYIISKGAPQEGDLVIDTRDGSYGFFMSEEAGLSRMLVEDTPPGVIGKEYKTVEVPNAFVRTVELFEPPAI